MRKFQVIQNLLPELSAHTQDPPAGQKQQQAIAAVMRSILGNSAQYLLPTLFTSGKLLLLVEAPVWASHIQNRKTSIINTANKAGLRITEINVKVNPVGAEKVPRTFPKRQRGLSANSISSIEKAHQHTTNPKLKAAFERLQKRIGAKQGNEN